MRRTLATAAACALALAGVSCATNPASGTRHVVFTTVKSEQEQARRDHEEIKRIYGLYQDQAVQDYVQMVGTRVARNTPIADWDFKFFVLDDDEINAFTTGGNHMYIYTALFQKCDTEDELAAVMAHEFAHVYARHVQKGTDRQMRTMLAAAGVGALGYAAGGKEHGQQYAGTAAGLAALAGQYFGMSYTREDEDEADRLGFQFYSHAGWDPNRFADFFRKMIAMGMDKTPANQSDHPTLKSRVEKTDQRAKNLPAEASRWRREPVAGPAQLRQIQQRATELSKTMPNDQQIANSKELLQAMPRSCLTPRDQVELPDQHAAQVDLLQKLQAQRDAQQGSQGRRRRG